jgi:hypothetical protein
VNLLQPGLLSPQALLAARHRLDGASINQISLREAILSIPPFINPLTNDTLGAPAGVSNPHNYALCPTDRIASTPSRLPKYDTVRDGVSQ